MRNNPIVSQEGIAVILVIGVISALVASGVMLNRQARGMMASSAALSDRYILSEMSRSGIEATVSVLETADSEDLLRWLLTEDGRDLLTADINRTLKLPDGAVDIRLTDERARVQVNALVDFPQARRFVPEQQQLWERLLFQLKSQFPDAPDFAETEFINALKDWLDSGDDDAITGLSGAESEYYGTLSTPYRPANAPIQHIGELLLIKGLPSRLYHGTPQNPGLAAYVTARGATGSRPSDVRFDGRVNLNTAPLAVIGAILPLEYQPLAEAIVDYRQERLAEKAYGILNTPTWYKSAPGCNELNLSPQLVTVVTDLFQITATARRGDQRLQMTASVRCDLSDNPASATCEVTGYQ